MEKRSKELLIVLRQKLNQKGLLFDMSRYDPNLELQETIGSHVDSQHNSQSYILRFKMNWEGYDDEVLQADLKLQIKFLHESFTNKLIFNSHHKGVLKLLDEVKKHNNNSFKNVGIDDTFTSLDGAITFWNSLQDCDLKVATLDLGMSLYDFFHPCSISNPFDFAKKEFFNNIFYLLFSGKLDAPIHLNNFIEEYNKECKISILNLFGKSGDNNKYYKQILTNNFNKLKNYGFFIKKNDEFQPTIFLRILRDIKLKSFSPFMAFNVLLEDLHGIAYNYCEIVEGSKFSEVRLKIEEYLMVIIECNKANYSPSEYKSAHKLAETKSGIRLLAR